MPEIPLSDLMVYFDAVRLVTRENLDQATDNDLFVVYQKPGPKSLRDVDFGTYPPRGESTHGPGGNDPGHDAGAWRVMPGKGIALSGETGSPKRACPKNEKPPLG